MLAHDVPVIMGLRPPRGLQGEAVITAGLTDSPRPRGQGWDRASSAEARHTQQVATGLGWAARLRNGGDPQVVTMRAPGPPLMAAGA